MLACVIFMNLVMPSESSPSILGIQSCSSQQFSLQLCFLIVCAAVSLYAIKINQEEQKLKIKYDINYRNGDIKFAGSTLW